MGATGCSVKNVKYNRGIKKGHNFRHGLIVLAMIVIMVSVPFVAAPPVLAAPAIGISAASGTPGSTVIISGTDFTVGDTYSIVFAPVTAYEQTLIGSTIIASGTTFSQTVTIPTAPWASFIIRVDTNRGNFSVPFQVTPSISLQITTGYVGDLVIATGAGFRAGTGVNILFGGTSVAALTSDTSGSLPSFTFPVPAMRSGSYAVYGSDTLATSPSVFFVLLTHLSASTLEGAVGSRVALIGSGFEYNSPFTFYWDGQVVGSIQISSSSSGNFTTDFVIPAAARGTHSIKAVDNSGRQANVLFVITPSFTLNPGNSKPGSLISISGSGFRANVNVTISFAGSVMTTQPAPITTDATGAFTATFIVPNVTAGSYTVRASDDANAVTGTLSIISTITLTPATGNVGMTLQVNGSGFTPSGIVSISYDNQVMMTANADATGSFTANLIVPASKAGAHLISAADKSLPGLVTTASFTMESVPPAKPNLLTPEPGTQASVTPQFTWSAVTDPSGVTYNLQVATDTGFGSVILTKQSLTTPGYQVTQAEAFGLAKKTTPYYWRVKAIDGAGNESDWTSPSNFYTQDSTPPPLPLLLNPQNDSQVTVLPAFSWSEVTDPSGVTYSLQIARDIGFTNLVIIKQGLTASNYQAASAEKLELTKKISPYYWRVKAIDNVGNESAWTSPMTFYTQDSTPPAVSISLKPEQGSKQGSQPTFSWTASDDPSGVTYLLQVAQDTAFNQIVVNKEGLTANTYKLSKTEKLDSSAGSSPGVYFWRVKATDGAGNDSGWSSTNEFKVQGFLQSGWPVYVAIVVGGLLLLGVGIFIGMHLKPREPKV